MICPLDFIRVYWKILFVLVIPWICLPIFLFNDKPCYRCLYVCVLMCLLWITEAMPSPLTALMPMVFFPLMSIMNSDDVARIYMNDTTMMLMGSVAIAIAFENTGLHIRVALYVIKFIGCSIKKLHIGISLVTMFISMWIANTAATALMIPIVEGTLQALQAEGLIKMWKPIEEGKDEPKPTNITQCYYISISYCSLMGGTGCILGSGSHLAYKGLYETQFKDSPGVEFSKWMAFNVPLMLLSNCGIILYLQFLYLGLCRPNSKAAQDLAIGKEAADTTRKIINNKITDLGPMKFAEGAVAFIFVLSIVLWFLKKPGFMPGWPSFITTSKVGDAVIAIGILIVFALLPMEADFIYFRSKDLERRPTQASGSILGWNAFSKQMHWGMLFILGGGFAMAKGAIESGLTELVADMLATYLKYNRYINLVIVCTTGAIITQFLSSNVACVTILTPIVLSVSVQIKSHPMFLGLANALACCFSFFLPVSTPPNALVSGPSRMGAREMMVSGIGTWIVCLVCLLVVYPLYAPLIWDMEKLPAWAK